jgi:hypothetical protein
MTRAHLLILLGTLVILAPFSGLPSSWLDIVLPLLGLAILIVGYTFRPQPKPIPRADSDTVSA